MQIGKIEVNNPIFLGPMAGVTDWAFRNICTELGRCYHHRDGFFPRALLQG